VNYDSGMARKTWEEVEALALRQHHFRAQIHLTHRTCWQRRQRASSPPRECARCA
jgi:hypothetical protein